MKLWVLGSGSRGNSVLVESRGTRVLVDAGFPPRVLADRLAAISVAPESIQGVAVTHEHADHARGVRAAAARWSWHVYATAGTLVAARDLPEQGVTRFAIGQDVAIGDLMLRAARVQHDAAEPVAVSLTSVTTGARAGVAYDLGAGSEAVTALLRDLDLLVLEANHDSDMLRASSYPRSVRERIAGRLGHLSNSSAAELARNVAGRTMRHLVLAHLSESCNTPGSALEAVRGALTRGRFRGRISAARQDMVAGPFDPGSARAGVASQLSLEL